MPEGPEVKIASDYFNEFFLSSKKVNFEIISEYYDQKYYDVFSTINDNLDTFQPTFTIGKNIFLKLKNNQIFNFHLGMTGGWSNELIKHCHFRVSDGKNELFFKDVRKFGKMKILTKSEFNINTALITGSKKICTTKAIPNHLNTLLTCFSPKSKNKNLTLSFIDEEIHLEEERLIYKIADLLRVKRYEIIKIKNRVLNRSI